MFKMGSHYPFGYLKHKELGCASHSNNVATYFEKEVEATHRIIWDKII
jgi:hypothetical protein